MQTVVPKIEGFVLVLDKKFRGQKAKILERNKEKGEVVVQILETLEIEKFSDDNVSEYVSFWVLINYTKKYMSWITE